MNRHSYPFADSRAAREIHGADIPVGGEFRQPRIPPGRGGPPANGAASEMDQMPIRGEAVRARILAHGRNNDSVAQRHLADLKLVEQMHGDVPFEISLALFPSPLVRNLK